jgi:actin-like ATPase involved in cell morphogenesis
MAAAIRLISCNDKAMIVDIGSGTTTEIAVIALRHRL